MIRIILLLYSEDCVAFGIRQICEQMGDRLTSTSTEEEFRNQFFKLRPDEVVLDLQTDDDDGIDALRFLSGECFIGRITLLSGINGWTLESARQLAESLGLTIAQVLNKPVKAGALCAALERRDKPAVPITRAELAAGISKGELLLEYQPIVSCARGMLIDIEALVRWERPCLGRVPPEFFIPLAEADPELMDRVTLAVAALAAQDWPSLKLVGFAGRIAINLSAQNVCRPDFPQRLTDLLMDRGLPPAHVKLEVTESAAVTAPAGALGNLLRLRRNGFSLSIDDFGTRYSSLAMLRQHTYSELKIDGTLIRGVHRSREALEIVRTILGLANRRGLRTVAEGVEDDELLPFLERLGVTFAQGYGISRPLAPSQLVDWIVSGQPQAAAVRPRVL